MCSVLQDVADVARNLESAAYSGVNKGVAQAGSLEEKTGKVSLGKVEGRCALYFLVVFRFLLPSCYQLLGLYLTLPRHFSAAGYEEGW